MDDLKLEIIFEQNKGLIFIDMFEGADKVESEVKNLRVLKRLKNLIEQ